MIAPGRDSEHISFARRGEDLGWVTNAGLRAAADNPDNVFGAVLSLLAGCHPAASLAASEARADLRPNRGSSRRAGDPPEQASEW